MGWVLIMESEKGVGGGGGEVLPKIFASRAGFYKVKKSDDLWVIETIGRSDEGI